MYEIRASVGRRRLYITLKGSVLTEEIRALVAGLLVELGRFRSAFDVITDISSVEPLSNEAMGELRGGMQALVSHGVRRVVHVVGRSAKAAVQFEHHARESGYEAHLAFTLKEAEAMFDGNLE
ncbi:MAG: hypothetical protein ACYC8T_03490 [Myxococcaceae bacterium]